MVAFVLGCPASKQVEIAFVGCKCQRKHAFRVLGLFVVNASRKHFPTHWLGHSPSHNWIAETVVAFVLGHLPSKQVEIAFVRWRCQREQASQLLGCFVANASRKHFPTHWLGHSPSQNWIAETMVAIVLGHLPSKQVEIAFVKSRGGHGLLLDGMNSQPTSKSSLNKNVGTDIVIPSLRPSVSFWFVKNT
jgi:hypothetical protein